VASQKLTCPGETALAAEVTVAVSVTAFPAATVETAVPPDVIARVTVEVLAAVTVMLTEALAVV
jgi:hypothetical protein